MLTRLFLTGALLAIIGLVSAVVTEWLDLRYDTGCSFAALGGFVLCLYCRVCRKLDKVNRPADEAWEAGYEIGHDVGWREGRFAERPKVVPLRGRETS